MIHEEFLQELLSRTTVSGLEEEGAGAVRQSMAACADEIRTDEIGDVVCVRNPEGRPRILMTAHVDEIGLMVSSITEDGRLQAVARGGIIPFTYPGHQVKVTGREGVLYGVVEYCRELSEKEKLKTSDFLIDIGADSAGEAKKLVDLGAPVVFDTQIRRMAGGRFSARALDDRLGVFIVMEAFKRAGERGCLAGVYAAATVGEETTKNGAYWTAARVKPDLAVVVDVTYASDCSSVNPADSGAVKLGGGPVLCNGPMSVKALNKRLLRCAGKLGMEVQIEAASRLSYTDADKIHFAGEGIPTVLVSIPLRYMHTPAEVADEADVESCIQLLTEFLMEWEVEKEA